MEQAEQLPPQVCLPCFFWRMRWITMEVMITSRIIEMMRVPKFDSIHWNITVTPLRKSNMR